MAVDFIKEKRTRRLATKAARLRMKVLERESNHIQTSTAKLSTKIAEPGSDEKPLFRILTTPCVNTIPLVFALPTHPDTPL